MIYGSMGFNKCRGIIIVFYVIVPLFKSQLEKRRSLWAKLVAVRTVIKLIAIVCGRNDSDFNNQMIFFWIFNMISITLSFRQSQYPYFYEIDFLKFSIKQISVSSLNTKNLKSNMLDVTSCYVLRFVIIWK